MAVSFSNTPSSIRVPLFYAELDNSQAGYYAQSLRTLLIGAKTGAGTAGANTPQIVARTEEARALYGDGSMLARMHEIYRANDPMGEVWCIAVDDSDAGVAASGSIALTGTPAAAGALTIYIAGERIQVTVAAGGSPTTVATMLAAAINAATGLPVTGTADNGTVTLTARNSGTLGNDITIVPNYRGALGGESTPAGLGVEITAMSGGSGAPDLDSVVAAMGDEEYDFIVLPWADTASLDVLATELNDQSGRWAWNRQIYGHVYSAARGSLSTLMTLGGARNDQHCTIAGFEPGVPTPAWEYAAAYAARNAVYISADPARPTQTGPLVGVLPALPGQRFLQTERQSLLFTGIATSFFGSGQMCVERAITTYSRNALGQVDPSYLDSETMHTAAYVVRNLRSVITSKYARHKLADDGTRFGAGAAIVTPSVIRGELAALYATLEDRGIVENSRLFQRYLVVERDRNDPNRLNVLFPPDFVNQLRVFAVLAQFRLQYPAALLAA